MGASPRARMALTVTVSSVAALSRRAESGLVGATCAKAPDASVNERTSVFTLTPYAGVNRIRFDGCDLSVARCDAPRSSRQISEECPHCGESGWPAGARAFQGSCPLGHGPSLHYV